ncbi:HD domain-containing protein 2 [Dermatophagoides pteronyssinus]|uniref:5'-deoxynucleotidase HDDC2 n=1 Tax=Dermatophagoides pteronyssinus TaxID=6956 RepID=A0ABQ8JL85_DERPT|nr:HD domain-containing protein 2 [Dermatophagoides pteronyssinus]
MSQRSVRSVSSITTEPPSKIDDGINSTFEDIIAEYKSSQESTKFQKNNNNFSIDNDDFDDNGGGGNSSQDRPNESMDCNNGCDVDVATATDDDTQSDRLIEFLCLTGRLKTLPRRGWILNNRCIKNPEPIAGHMYRMAIMSMLFDDGDDDNSTNSNNNDNSMEPTKSTTKLNAGKMIQLSLIHDMAECIVGDITPMDGIDADEKHRNELIAMEKLASLLPPKQSKRLIELYREYESHKSPESLIVKELDRFDICLQAFQYERQEYFNQQKRIIRFDKFFQIALEHVHHPLLRKMVERLCNERDRFWIEEIVADINNHKAAAEALIAAQQDNLPVDIFTNVYPNGLTQQQMMNIINSDQNNNK